MAKSNDALEKMSKIAAVRTVAKECFIVMSFAGNPILESYYEEAVAPTLRSCGLQPCRIDQQDFTGSIDAKIRRGIENCRIVLVDLTEDRPNCYFEAGYAVALGKDIIFQRLSAPGYEAKFEFDVKDYPHVVYRTISDLKKKLKKRVNAILAASSL